MNMKENEKIVVKEHLILDFFLYHFIFYLLIFKSSVF